MEQSPSGETLVARTARALSRLSLDSEQGAYLGAEQDLLAQLGISRPTLRQAAKIVESDRLISVRRGTNGGFYAERPDAADAIRALTRFLRLRGATIGHIAVVSRMISEEAAGLAAACVDEGLRVRLAEFATTIASYDTRRAIIFAETELARLIATMSGNPAIELVMEIGYTFGMAEDAGNLYASAEDRAAARKLQADLCHAVLSRDPDVARLMMRRRGALLGEWLAHKDQTQR